MYVSELQLQDFRNYREATVKAPPGLILISGPNGAGKTNLLEALHVLGLGRSFRTSRDRDLLRHGAAATAIRATAHSGRGEQVFELVYDGARKRASLNGEVLGRLLDYVGALTVVAFAPDDLALVKGEPAGRRRFLNVWLGQESRDYLFTLQRYNTVLRARNALLARGAPAAEREPYDRELVASGARLTFLRTQAAEALGPEAAAAYGELAPEGEDLAVAFLPSVAAPHPDEEAIAAAFERELSERGEEERRRGLTLAGPHRDDLELHIRGREARRYASEGQQRTVALSLRLAQFRLLRRKRGEPPLLLLDDVASELDAARQGRLEEAIAGAEQTWLTATAAPFGLEPDAKFTISSGQIESVA